MARRHDRVLRRSAGNAAGSLLISWGRSHRADLIAGSRHPHCPVRAPRAAPPRVRRRTPAPQPTTRRCAPPHHQPAQRAPPASTCLPPPRRAVRRALPPPRRKRRRTAASSARLTGLLLDLHLLLHALADVGFVPLPQRAADAVGERSDLDDG